MALILGIAAALALAPSMALADLEIGKKPPTITLKGSKGGKVDGSSFSTKDIKGKVYTVFYVDPDEKTVNDHVSSALKKENFDLAKYGSIAVINMDATWLPNAAIESSLKEKQIQYPNTIYVKDMDKAFVDKWGVEDDNNNIIVFDKMGSVIFFKYGKLRKKEVATMIAAIKANL